MKKRWKVATALGGSFALAGSIAGFSTTQAMASTGVKLDTGINPQIIKASTVNSNVNGNNIGSVAVVLGTDDQEDLNQFVEDVYDPSSPLYRHYLTPQQFAADYGAPTVFINWLVNLIKSYHLQATVVPGNMDIDVTGSYSNLSKLFGIPFYNMTYKGINYIGTTGTPTLPAQAAEYVKGAFGIDTLPMFKSLSAEPAVMPSSTSTPGSTPTGIMPSVLEQHYDATSLYKAGFTGKGQTIGIATLADFNTSDAYYFWKYNGLNVNPNRISKILVDGGSGPVNWDNGSIETTLDVEQAGAIAPGANIDVYEAPNTNGGFINLFYNVAGADQVQQMSVSWGGPEDFVGSNYVNELSLAFEQGAAEGIAMFAAAGDAGAYDSAREGFYDPTPNIDSPADSPYVTAAGGTTLPGTQNYGPVSISVLQEQVWGWDYLAPLWQLEGYSSSGQFLDALFPAGGGGGFSEYFQTPWYQQNLERPQASGTFHGPYTEYSASSGMSSGSFAAGTEFSTGRSIPDVSMNADPQTGDNVYITAPGYDPSQYEYYGWNQIGGTSAVAPELAGFNALMDQADNLRIGFWNPQIYNMPQDFNDIQAGDNWFFKGVPGYDEGSGLGTPDYAALAAGFKNPNPPAP